MAKYAWIKKYSNEFPIALMCKILRVSRSYYYEWINKVISNRDKQDKELMVMVSNIFQEGRGTYGSRRIISMIARQGIYSTRWRCLAF